MSNPRFSPINTDCSNLILIITTESFPSSFLSSEISSPDSSEFFFVATAEASEFIASVRRHQPLVAVFVGATRKPEHRRSCRTGPYYCSRSPFSMASSKASLNPFAITITGFETDPITDSKLNTNVISEPTPKKTNRGRIKIPIEKILNKNKKHVTFSKRRKGLFKKASELCVLCDVNVAIVTFSEAGKVYAFGHPSTDVVIHRYLHGCDGAKHEYGGDPIENPLEDPRMPWWERPIEELGLWELESFREALKQTICNLERRITQLDYESQSECKAEVKFDFDYDLRLNQAGMVPTICNQMNCCYNDQMKFFYNDYHHMDGVGAVDPTISFLSSEFHSMTSQYDQSDINSIVAMANFNRSNRGYGEF